MDQYEENQLIWARAKGHPWWPGIVITTQISHKTGSDYKVQFIGEFTHDILPPSSIRPFEEKQESSMKLKNKRLQNAISYVEKSKPGEITIKNIKLVNQEIEKIIKQNRAKPVEKPTKDSQRSSHQVKDLKLVLKKFLKLKSLGKIKNFSNIDDILEILQTTEDSGPKSANISKNFVEILKNFPEIPTKICKFLLKTGVNHESKFGKLSSIIEDFQILHQKIKTESKLESESIPVANPTLRKHVCRKLAFYIEKSGKNKRESQVQALNIEASIRSRYQEMGPEYLKKCRIMLRSIKPIN